MRTVAKHPRRAVLLHPPLTVACLVSSAVKAAGPTQDNPKETADLAPLIVPLAYALA
ncbi:hypothetical protein GCM10020295_44010 [Streptomyces cinereospinus]